MSKSIFDPIKMGSLAVKNRVIRSATAEMYAYPDGRLRVDDYLRLYGDMAKGGVGVIVTGLMGVSPGARAREWMPTVGGDDFVSDFRQIADAVHAFGCKIVVQLAHSGGMAGMAEGGGPPMSSSEVAMIKDRPARAMTRADIAAVIADYAKAAGVCKKAGADGVQIHGAHGYLVTQFLSPYYNKRSDEYGGAIENRGRFALDLVKALRGETGDGYPLWIKINGTDLVEESITPEEFHWVCMEMEKCGIDVIEVSAGVVFSKDTVPFKLIANEEDEGSFVSEALALAGKVGVPVISTGGFRTPGVIDKWLNQGGIEGIGLCRPLICEPDLINRWQNGDKAKARCISCNRCLLPKDGFGCKAFAKA